MPTGIYVRKPKDILTAFMKHVSDDWQWIGGKSHKYGSLTINNKHYRAHRLSYELFNGPIPENMEVLHDCDDPGCVNPKHLHLGTQADNIHEMYNRGREDKIKPRPRGEKHVFAKLTDDQVREIRHLSKQGLSYNSLAKKFSVKKPTICDIVTGRHWKHLLP